MLEEGGGKMENQDPVVEDLTVAAQDDQEPDVEAHDLSVEDLTVAAQDDKEPDVEAHDWTVEAAADVNL
jgi:hypothetical protein